MSAIDEETRDSMSRALDDIREWFEDQGADATMDNLSAGATLDHIVQTAGTQGLVLHPELQWLYMRHDGQSIVGHFPLFEWCTFLSVERACLDAHEDMMARYFGATSRHDAVDVEYTKTLVFDEPLEDGELDKQWFPFANQEGDFYAVHARSGRVARLLKGDDPAGVIVAPSLRDFLCDYADALWSDAYVLMGDPSLDAVQQSGLIYLKAYAGRVDAAR